jgi:hypothetical protein
MPELNEAKPLKMLNADEKGISFLYLLTGGDYDNRVVLVSSVITPTYEETSVFLCEDWSGEDADWGNSLSTIYHVDTEDALNKIGYTTKVALDKEKQ